MQTVGVLGAGLMGAGIAQVSVENGYRVLLKDEVLAGIARGQKQIQDNLDVKVQLRLSGTVLVLAGFLMVPLQVKKKQLKPFDRDTLLSKVVPLTPANVNWLKHFGTADIVIEAVPENLDLKHRVVRPHAVLGSDARLLVIRVLISLHVARIASTRSRCNFE